MRAQDNRFCPFHPVNGYPIKPGRIPSRYPEPGDTIPSVLSSTTVPCMGIFLQHMAVFSRRVNPRSVRYHLSRSDGIPGTFSGYWRP